MDIAIQEEVEHLLGALGQYREYTGKTAEEVMSKKGRDLSFTLFERFKQVRTPSDYVQHRAAILSKAKSLDWALGPISPRARELAESLMGGLKSVVGRVVAEGDRLLIRTAALVREESASQAVVKAKVDGLPPWMNIATPNSVRSMAKPS
jgi:hypothetical protein